MKITLLVPGTGHFFCGSCLRDDWLGRALKERGHQVTVVPLYLPLVHEEGATEAPILMGGINMYLQQRWPWAKRIPRGIARLLDRPGLLRFASKRGNMTDASELGAMTVSMLAGENGCQSEELEKLIAWMLERERPDVVVLSNALLSGAVRRLKAALGCPLLVTLQGEAPFLDGLAPHWSDAAWGTLREIAPLVDGFVPVSRYTGDLMSARLALDPNKVHVIHNGLHLDGYRDEPLPRSERGPTTIGYLARMCEQKGLHTLVDAFIDLHARAPGTDVRLRVAGVMLAEDRPYVAALEARLAAAGIRAHVEFLPNVDRAGKLAFLRGLHVLSVPATYGESFGLYVLEAMASGVPVVQPRHGGFPEVVEATGGGILCAPDDARDLSGALSALLVDDDCWTTLATRGRIAVLERFSAERMAGEFEQICETVIGQQRSQR